MGSSANSITGIVMGFITFLFVLCYTYPQLYKLCKTRNTAGISLITYILFIADNMLWIAWSCSLFVEQTRIFDPNVSGDPLLFKISLIPAIIANTFNVLMMLFIISFKITNILLCKKMHITELQLCKKVIGNYKGHHLKQFWTIYLSSILGVGAVLTVFLVVILLVPLTNDGHKFTWLIALNFVASVGWEAFDWPQLIKTFKTKNTAGISLFWSIFLLASCIFNFIYDLILGLNSGGGFDYGVLGGLIFSGIISNGLFLALKLINLVKAKKMHMTELEYIKKVYKCK